jgi:hypothetical protein
MQEGSFWSVGSETLDRDYADFEKYRKYLKETGVGYARLQSGWAKTEQVKGVYDFSWIDASVVRAQKAVDGYHGRRYDFRGPCLCGHAHRKGA